MDKVKCAACDFKAVNENKMLHHIILSSDKAHRELLKEKAKNEMNDVRDEVENSWDDVRVASGEII